MIELHSCSYYCERPDCIKTQRDEMRDNRAYEQGEEMYKAIRRECDAKLAKFEAENAALREEIRELNQMGFTHENAAAQKAALEDAERYRWFRSKRLWDADSFPWPKDFEYPEPCLWDEGEMLDAAIDSVRKS